MYIYMYICMHACMYIGLTRADHRDTVGVYSTPNV